MELKWRRRILLVNYSSTCFRLGYHGVWIRSPPFLQRAKELLPLFYLGLKHILRIILIIMDLILIPPHLRIRPFAQNTFQKWTHRSFFIINNIRGHNRRTQRILLINPNVVHYQLQPQNQYHHQHHILLSPTFTLPPHLAPFTQFCSSPRSSLGCKWTHSPTRWGGLVPPTPCRPVILRRDMGVP